MEKRAEERNEGRDEERGETIHNTDTKKPQEKHTPSPRHKNEKMKKQVAGQQAEPIKKIWIQEYAKYMDMGGYGNMEKICVYGKDTKKSYRFIYLMV